MLNEIVEKYNIKCTTKKMWERSSKDEYTTLVNGHVLILITGDPS